MRERWSEIGTVLVVLLLTACSRGTGGPVVTIDSPASGTRIATGVEVEIQSSATDPDLVQRIEMYINGDLIAENAAPVPEGQASFSVIQRWVPVEPGEAEVQVYAYDAKGERSLPSAIVLEVTGDPLLPLEPTAPAGGEQTPTGAAPDATASPTEEIIKPTATAPVEVTLEGSVNASAGLNVRANPDLGAERIAGLNLGDTVTVIARNSAGDWFRIRFGPDNREGWVVAQYITLSGDAQTLPQK